MNSKGSVFTVLHLSTGHLGGAGLAARRLNSALNSEGYKSEFYALARSEFSPGQFEVGLKRKISTRFLSSITTYLQERVSQRIFFSSKSINSLLPDFDLELAKYENPIIHIHNWYNLINVNRLLAFKRLGVPIVITLHDQRWMTGGCHYSFDCKGFKSKCTECPMVAGFLGTFPRDAHKKAKLVLDSLTDCVVFIAPSRWMMSQAIESSLLKQMDVRFIPNVHSNDSFQATLKTYSKNLSVNSGRVRLGIASMDPGSFVKGGDLIDSLSRKVAAENLPFDFIFLSTFPQDDTGKNKFWSSIDCLLVLSRAENSPNVIHEAKQFGIPVVASLVGGITELLHPEYDLGIDLSELNTAKILEKLERFLENESSIRDSYQMQLEYKDYVNNALDEHVRLYKELIPK